MKISESIARCMEIVANGCEDEETGEVEAVDEVKITFATPNHGEFEIVVRRPQLSCDTEDAAQQINGVKGEG